MIKRIQGIVIGLIGVAGVGVVACSSSSSMSVTDFCTAVQSATIAYEVRCEGGSAASYQAEAAGVAKNLCSGLAAAVTAGRITYDASQASGCLDAFTTVSCTGVTKSVPACDAALKGAVADGKECFSDQDCASTSSCIGSGATCSGICTARTAAGQPCATSKAGCVIGYTCPTKADAVCTADVNPPLANLGETCGDDPKTMTYVNCAGGLRCPAPLTGSAVGKPSSAVCVKAVKEGGACTPGAMVCEPFTYCDSSSKTCKVNPGVGGACTGSVSGKNENMECLGAYCKLSSMTATEISGTCVALADMGGACVADAECLSGACSVGSVPVGVMPTKTGTCQAPTCSEI